MRIKYMRIIFVFFILNNAYAMENPAEAPSLLQQFLHKVDKTLDPFSYVTDGNASGKIAEFLLKLDPQHPNHTPFSLAKDTLEQIHRGFEREIKILEVVKETIKNNHYYQIEQIISIEESFFCPAVLLLIHAYQERKLKKATELLSSMTNEKSKNTNKSNLLTPGVEELLTETNTGWINSGLNYVRKNLIDTVGYLTNKKSVAIANELQRFCPTHANSLELNPELPSHALLIKNTFDRITKLLVTIEKYLGNNKLLKLNEINKYVCQEYFSPNAKAVLAGYLSMEIHRKTLETLARATQQEHNLKNNEEDRKRLQTALPLDPNILSAGLNNNPVHQFSSNPKTKKE